MQIVTFRCPHCSANLKMRGDEFVGQWVDCPDCRQSLLLRRTGDGKLLINKANEAAEARSKTSAVVAGTRASSQRLDPSATIPPTPGGVSSKWRELTQTMRGPLALRWIGGAVVATGILALVLWLSWPRRQSPSAAAVAGSTAPSAVVRQPTPPAKPNTPPREPKIDASATRPAVTNPTLAATKPIEPAAKAHGVSIKPLIVPADVPSVSPSRNHIAFNERSGAVPKETVPLIPSREPVVAPRPAAKGSKLSTNGGPPTRTVNIAAGLRQPIVRFEQSKPVPLRDVLATLEDMLAVPIRGSKRDIADLDDLLQTQVTFDLHNTTVNEVLKSVLAQAKLTFETEADAIRLRKPSAVPADGGLH